MCDKIIKKIAFLLMFVLIGCVVSAAQHPTTAIGVSNAKIPDGLVKS
ncbi:MAG: hypothetical protein LBL74_08080 [Bacteroidales bacterium]|jgi:hypothetical protein|nr:hypothetical protein [Bacteroidales bacterium]